MYIDQIEDRALELRLPFPPSANRLWRSFSVAGGRRPVVVMSRAAKDYKGEVARRAAAAGVVEPIRGRVSVSIGLFPAMPKDGPARRRRDPAGWDDTVRAIDVDNALKVLLDALQGIVIQNDKWVRRIVAERFEPDGAARVEVRVERFVAGDGKAGSSLS